MRPGFPKPHAEYGCDGGNNMAVTDWNVLESSSPSTFPTDGAKVRARLSNGKSGPATYYENGGFVLFNLPWGDSAPVQSWQPWDGPSF